MDSRGEKPVLETPKIDILKYHLALKLLGNKNKYYFTQFLNCKPFALLNSFSLLVNDLVV
jgi:hypothetical protein